jgi:tetratricopeptide (TPR) repeat protein
MYVGCLRAMRGCFDEARNEVHTAGETYRELGESAMLTNDWTHHAAAVELLAGNPAAAVAVLREACDTLARGGDRAWLATHTATLAEAMAAQGHHEDALELSASAIGIAPGDDLTAQTLALRARGQALARVDRTGEGGPLVREALDLLASSDELNAKGESSMALGEILSLEGRATEALRAVEDALDLFEAKGNLVLAGRARVLRDQLSVCVRS